MSAHKQIVVMTMMMMIVVAMMIMTTMVMVMAMVQGHDGREHLRVPLGRMSPVACLHTNRSSW